MYAEQGGLTMWPIGLHGPWMLQQLMFRARSLDRFLIQDASFYAL